MEEVDGTETIEIAEITGVATTTAVITAAAGWLRHYIQTIHRTIERSNNRTIEQSNDRTIERSNNRTIER